MFEYRRVLPADGLAMGGDRKALRQFAYRHMDMVSRHACFLLGVVASDGAGPHAGLQFLSASLFELLPLEPKPPMNDSSLGVIRSGISTCG